MSDESRKVALVLGSGAARGWSHIGVIRALADAGIEPDLICGTSIGAVVGAAAATGQLDAFEEWITGLDQVAMFKLLDAGLSDGGFIGGRRLIGAFAKHVGKMDIEDCKTDFVAVATEIGTGREVWLQDGPIADAVRASIAIPGLFAPVRLDGRWLVDGGLVNPVPVSVARALGADVVIAVNLNGDLLRSNKREPEEGRATDDSAEDSGWTDRATTWLKDRLPARFRLAGLMSGEYDGKPPGMLSVIADSIDIMQDRITRARLAGEPPDILISPRLGHIGILEFDRAEEAIDDGRSCAEDELDEIRRILGD